MKLDSLVQHELYGKYKTAPTQEKREKARQEYLDRRGVPDSFRKENVRSIKTHFFVRFS